MGLKLGTQETANLFFKMQSEGDPKFMESIAGLNLSLLMVCHDCPGNVDRQLAISFVDGRFTEIIASEKPAPSDLRTAPFDHTKYDFRVQAPISTIVDLCNGKMDLIEAIPVTKIDGDFAKLMANAQGFMRFIQFLGTLDLEP
jgi:hypothetical protein